DYFICSNQFWAHKNHGIIIDALKIAREQGRPHFVVFTGITHDFRDPGYFPKLMERAARLGVDCDFKTLGLIPKEHQIALIRQAKAVIQPTLFEGAPGGGAVYDAIAVGQRIILSDIPINREISDYVDDYFDPMDARQLDKIMCAMKQL